MDEAQGKLPDSGASADRYVRTTRETLKEADEAQGTVDGLGCRCQH